MGIPIPLIVQTFLKEPVYAHFATINKDGSPRVAMMWVECNDTNFIVNGDLTSMKVKNLRRDPRVYLSITRPSEAFPRRLLQVPGRVVSMITTGANAHIDGLAEKYMGVARYPRRKPGMRRIKIVVEPLELNSPWGLDILAEPFVLPPLAE